MVPPAGENNKGVRKAIPIKPNLLLIFMAKRDVFVNRFRGLSCRNPMVLSRRAIAVLRKIINETVSIMPKIVQITVSYQLSFNAKPANGPPKNLSILAKSTVEYLAKLMFSSKI